MLTFFGGSFAAEVKHKRLVLGRTRALQPFLPQLEIQVMDGRGKGRRKGVENGLPYLKMKGGGTLQIRLGEKIQQQVGGI